MRCCSKPKTKEKHFKRIFKHYIIQKFKRIVVFARGYLPQIKFVHRLIIIIFADKFLMK